MLKKHECTIRLVIKQKVTFGQGSPDDGILKIPKHVEIGTNDGILTCFKRF
jgi:hypothetical protein